MARHAVDACRRLIDQVGAQIAEEDRAVKQHAAGAAEMTKNIGFCFFSSNT